MDTDDERSHFSLYLICCLKENPCDKSLWFLYYSRLLINQHPWVLVDAECMIK